MDLNKFESADSICCPIPSSRAGLFGKRVFDHVPFPAAGESTLGSDGSDSSEFSVQSGSSGILNEKMSEAINNLSDESDYEDMPLDQLVKKLLQPDQNYVLPRLTPSQLESKIKGEDVITLLNEIAQSVSPTWKKYLGQYHGLYVKIVGSGTKQVFSLSIQIYNLLRYCFAIFFTALVAIANSFQFTMENTHRGIIRSDIYANSMLRDRQEEKRYSPTIDNYPDYPGSKVPRKENGIENELSVNELYKKQKKRNKSNSSNMFPFNM